MPQRRHLSQNERQRALGYLLAGQTQRHVAAEFNVSQSVIGRLWQLYLDTGDVQRRQGQGRLRVTTEAQDRRLCLMVRRRRFDSAVTLNRDFEQTYGYRISVQTIRNRLHAANLWARRPVVRPPLTPHHRRCRVVFARDHVQLGRQRLRNILWSDESRFNLDFNDGRRRVWRQRNERFHDWCVAEHDRYGGGSVLVWSGISLDGRTDLYVIRNGALTGVRYRDEVLDPVVRPYAGACGHGFILMDDNARPHRARVVNQYLEQEGIERMEWPARSPDLNPIEHAWDILQRRLSSRIRQPRTAEELSNFLVEEWHRIPVADIRRLILSFPRRCQEVINARGGHTRY